MFKKFIYSVILFALTSNLSFAQLIFSSDSLNFNTCNELQSDSIRLVIHNNESSSVLIKDFKFFNTYSKPAFSVKGISNTNIEPGDSIEFYVYFKPRHNIYHNSELFIITEPSVYSKTIDLKGQGKYSMVYYTNTENKTEEVLKSSLKTIIGAGYVSLGYNLARDAMFMTIDNQKTNGQGASVNTLECVYTGRKVVGYTSRTDAQNTGDPTKNFNTEHTFPQGFFSENEPMRSDLHHLFPTDGPANNSRNNFAFGVATTPYVNDAINNPSHLGANGLYEPRNVQKGRTARAMMYFVLRYQDYSNFFLSQETILRTWNENFPPNNVDIKRNNDIALQQKNRNPFVDYPQFAERITKLIGTSTETSKTSAFWLDTINTSLIIDTTNSISIELSFVNTGNKQVRLYDFNSIDTNIMFINTDTIKIEAGESASKNVLVKTKNKNGEFISTINFNTNYAQGANFVLRYGVDSVKSGFNWGLVSKQIKFYPNPAKNEVTIISTRNTFYKIYNLLGAEKQSGVLDKGFNVVHIKTLESGTYFIKTGEGNAKLIKID